MLFVETGSKKGKSVRLHPAETSRIFMDATDDGKSIVIVGDRVVRVDEPSSDMYAALNDRVYPAGPEKNKHTLLIETDDDPTPLPEVTTNPAASNQINSKSDLDALAERFGYTLVPVTSKTEPVAAPTGGDTGGSKDNGNGGKK